MTGLRASYQNITSGGSIVGALASKNSRLVVAVCLWIEPFIHSTIKAYTDKAGAAAPRPPKPPPPRPPKPPPPLPAAYSGHGYEPTMSLISPNVGFQGQPGPHLLAVSFSHFGPTLCENSYIRKM